MDLNHLLEREQVERMRADRATCDRSRAVHEGLAASYRARLEGLRRQLFGDAAFRPMTTPYPA